MRTEDYRVVFGLLDTHCITCFYLLTAMGVVARAEGRGSRISDRRHINKSVSEWGNNPPLEAKIS